jgi:uncharacterized membrane protein YfcA
MMDPHIYDFSSQQWLVLVICALSVGISKTGIPGFGTFVVPLIATIMPPLPSTGLLLGLLILADIFAAIYYRRHAQWHHIWGLLPWALAGVVAGYLLMGRISNETLRPIIAVVVLVMLAWGFLRKNDTEPDDGSVRHGKPYVIFMGFLAGLTTMLANAAGPVMTAYLLASGLPKNHFIGTAAWFFFIINWLKVPFQISLGGINLHSVKTDLMLLPAIIVGAVLGILILRKLPQKVFNIAVAILTALAAIKLFF